MSWPSWPQNAATAVAQPVPPPSVGPAPVPTPVPAVGAAPVAGATTPMSYPPPTAAPQTYTAAQYAALSPEQQYAMQQNWQQWQTYHQQYAQWHAQYGEQVIVLLGSF